MNLFAEIVGYIVITAASFTGTVIGAIWLLEHSPVNRKVMYILRLGMKAYMAMPRQERKY